MAQHIFTQLYLPIHPFWQRAIQLLLLLSKLPTERKIFPGEEDLQGKQWKNMREGIWKNSLPPIYRRFLEALLVWRFPKTHSTSQRQGQLRQVDFKAATVSSWNLSQGWNVRSRPRRDDLMYKMQVRQPERHDECNLSQGSAIYHNGITGNKQSREVDR